MLFMVFLWSAPVTGRNPGNLEVTGWSCDEGPGRALGPLAPGLTRTGFRGKGGSAVVASFRDRNWSRGHALDPETSDA